MWKRDYKGLTAWVLVLYQWDEKGEKLEMSSKLGSKIKIKKRVLKIFMLFKTLFAQKKRVNFKECVKRISERNEKNERKKEKSMN